MTERENLPAVIAAQAVVVQTKQRGNLVGRGLFAIQNNKTVAPPNNNDDLYNQARMVFDHEEGWWWELGILSWAESGKHDLSAAFKIFQQLADENYGKAFYPLSILCGRKDINAYLEQDEVRLRRHPTGTQYLGQQVREFVKSRMQYPKYAQQAFEWCIANQSNEDPELWFDLGKMYERSNQH